MEPQQTQQNDVKARSLPKQIVTNNVAPQISQAFSTPHGNSPSRFGKFSLVGGVISTVLTMG